MREVEDSAVTAVMEQLIENGAKDMGALFACLLDLAMRIEQKRLLGARHYERSPDRCGYANGGQRKQIDTPAGTLMLNVRKTVGHEEPLYPQSLERGRRSSRTVMMAVAGMYVKGASTRDAEMVLADFGIESLSSNKVSRAARLLGEKLSA